MKKYLLLLLLTSVISFANAQGLTKTAKGDGTVLFRGNAINLNIGETEFTANINNLKSVLGRKAAPIYGVQLKGKNDSGLANIFQAGSFVPAASMGGYAGLSKAWGVPDNYKEEFTKLLNDWKKDAKDFDVSFRQDLINIVNKGVAKSSPLGSVIVNIIETYSLPDIIIYLENDNSTDPLSKNLNKQLTSKAKDLSREQNGKMKTRSNLVHQYQKALSYGDVNDGEKYKQLFLFAFGSFEGSTFKRLITLDTNNFKNSFQDINYRGGWGGLGVNYQVGRFMFGATWSIREMHNFDLLSKKEYTQRTTRTIDNTVLTEEKKITAYAGAYGEVKINEFKTDVVYRLSLNDEDKNQMLLNVYLNAQYNSSNKIFLPNTTNIGTGFYFFNKENKFLGGLYVELPDVQNNNEKAKPVVDQNLRDPLKRLTFGIVGKISIASFMNTF